LKKADAEAKASTTHFQHGGWKPMITCPVALAFLLISPIASDSADLPTKIDKAVLQAAVSARKSEKVASNFGLKAPSVRMPLAVDSDGRRYEPVQQAVYVEEESSGDILPSPQRVVQVPILVPVPPK
jgi:hypothetical protein